MTGSVPIQVLGSTLDGNSVNRRLVKIHEPSADVVYKVKNPYAEDERLVLFLRSTTPRQDGSELLAVKASYVSVFTLHYAIYTHVH